MSALTEILHTSKTVRKRKPTSQKKIRASVASYAPEEPVSQPWFVPSRWLKTYIAVVFLPIPVWLLTQTFFSIFAGETANSGFWHSVEFWFFAMGVLMWLVIFFGLPRMVRVYVFGHELTHALCVYASMGRVARFHVGRDGGHIIADKISTLIALAPYFFPIYSIILVVVYGWVAFFFPEVSEHAYANHVLFCGIGFTWAFHITFTCWMLAKEQADIAYGGRIFSWMAIYIVNLLCLSVLLILASSHATFTGFSKEFYRNTIHLLETLATWYNAYVNR